MKFTLRSRHIVYAKVSFCRVYTRSMCSCAATARMENACARENRNEMPSFFLSLPYVQRSPCTNQRTRNVSYFPYQLVDAPLCLSPEQTSTYRNNMTIVCIVVVPSDGNDAGRNTHFTESTRTCKKFAVQFIIFRVGTRHRWWCRVWL